MKEGMAGKATEVMKIEWIMKFEWIQPDEAWMIVVGAGSSGDWMLERKKLASANNQFVIICGQST